MNRLSLIRMAVASFVLAAGVVAFQSSIVRAGDGAVEPPIPVAPGGTGCWDEMAGLCGLGLIY